MFAFLYLVLLGSWGTEVRVHPPAVHRQLLHLLQQSQRHRHLEPAGFYPLHSIQHKIHSPGLLTCSRSSSEPGYGDDVSVPDVYLCM
jgi:hypothetical protein